MTPLISPVGKIAEKSSL